MLNSFFKTKSEGDFLCCVDDYEELQHLKDKGLFVESIDNDHFYKEWFSRNKRYIPTELGGLAVKEKNPLAYRPENYRTAQWTKKIVSMKLAIDKYISKYDHFMWVDCDCFFTDKFNEEKLSNILKDKSFCYHLGNDRIKKNLGVETGLIGFKNNSCSIKLVKAWIGKYENDGFRKYKQWNDAHMFYFILNERKKFRINGMDLVEDYSSNGRSRSHVIIRGKLGKYFDHEKGLHKKKM